MNDKGSWVPSTYLDKDCWETPDALFETYNSLFNFVLDAAANGDNRKCPVWFGPGGVVEDALTADWQPYFLAGNVWMNPPYSRGLQRRFVQKAIDEVTSQPGYYGGVSHQVVALLPADTSTKLFHDLVWPYGDVTFLKGRVTFKGAPGKPKFASLVAIF